MFIPSIPYPYFPDIFRVLFNKNKFSLDKVFLSENKGFYQYYSRGSDALACLSRSIGGKAPVVFVPSYYCNESLDDLRNSSATLVFYNVNLDMVPDWKHIEELTSLYSPTMFVLTHYFGSVNDVDGAINYCNKNACELVHDCAHHLLPSEEIMRAPGFVLFSPHKLLPVPPLAFVLCNQNDAKRLIKEKKSLFKVSDCVWLMKRVVQKYLSFLSPSKLSQLPPDLSGVVTKRGWEVSSVSKFSLLLLKAACYKIANAQKSRVSNYKTLHYLLLRHGSNDRVETFNLNKVISPYSYVFTCPANQQTNFYKYLRKCEVPVNTWPDLPPEVMENYDIYENSIRLRQTILLLPVHQSINESQNNYIGDSLLKTLSGM